MSIRVYLFCDICNPLGVRCPEQRRGMGRGDEQGRRITDGRSWIESDAEDAVREQGWSITGDGLHICPQCTDNGRHLRPVHVAGFVEAHPLRKFVFCDVCNPQGFRYVEQRRGVVRGDWQGRRVTDGRAWFETDAGATAAVENGWAVTPDGRHLCPTCQARHPELLQHED